MLLQFLLFGFIPAVILTGYVIYLIGVPIGHLFYYILALIVIPILIIFLQYKTGGVSLDQKSHIMTNLLILIFICLVAILAAYFQNKYQKDQIKQALEEESEITDQDIEKLTPNIKLGVVSSPPYHPYENTQLERYNFSIQNTNKDSAPVVNFTIGIAFEGIVQEILPQLILTYGQDASVAILETGGTDVEGNKFYYKPDRSQLLEEYGISISAQKKALNEETLNTNIVTFYCREFPVDALFQAFIVVNKAANPPSLHSVAESITDGTYEGQYDYSIKEKKFTKKIKGTIK